MPLKLPIRLVRPCQVQIRKFTTSQRSLQPYVQEKRRVVKRGPEQHIYQDIEPPLYPYGKSHVYKQSNKGLYGGLRIRYGNNVSKKTETKTRRTWRPNILRRRVYSKALNTKIDMRIAARVLRTIDKCGGLDEYLLGEKPARMKELGEYGWKLRWVIMNTPTIRKRMAEESARLGVSLETRFERGWITQAELPSFWQAVGKAAQTDALAKEAEIMTVDGATAEQEEKDAAKKTKDEDLNWKELYTHYKEKEYRAHVFVNKLHNKQGRAGRKSPRQELTVAQFVEVKKPEKQKGLEWHRVEAREGRKKAEKVFGKTLDEHLTVRGLNLPPQRLI